MRTARQRALGAFNSLVWRWPGRPARKLFEFGLAEHGSWLDLMAAARLSPSPERRALYLRHALDEGRHRRMFARRSSELREQEGRPPLGMPRADFEDLFERLGERRFLAFIHLGERRGRAQFETYRDWFRARGDDKSASLFEAILEDEQRHESYSRQLLVELCGDDRAARRALLRARAWEAWRSFRRAGRALAVGVEWLLLMALFVAIAPVALALRALRPARPGWQLPPPGRPG
jgi:hypothetical protein